MTRDLWLFFASLCLFSIGYGCYFFSWPLFVQSLGASAVELGYLSALASLVGALSVIPGGYLADRFERRWQLILGWAMCIPVPLLYLAARDWRQLIPGVVLFAASIFNVPHMNAYIAAKAQPGRLSSAMSVVYAGFSIGFVLGPLLANPIQVAWGVSGVFRAAAFFFGISTAVIFFVSPDHPPARFRQRCGVGRRGLELPGPELCLSCLLFGGVAAALYFSWHFVAPFARDVLHHGVEWVNTAGAVTGLGGALLAVLLGRYADRAGPRRGLAVGLGLHALGMVGLVTLGRWPVIWLVLALRGSFDGVKTLMTSTIAQEVEADQLGRSLGFYNLTTGVGYTVGPIMGGYAYSWCPAAPFWLAAGASVLLGLYVFQTAHRRQRLTGHCYR
ncbi:MAG: MFS transporter [Betaproteobacteria bacterium]